MDSKLLSYDRASDDPVHQVGDQATAYLLQMKLPLDSHPDHRADGVLAPSVSNEADTAVRPRVAEFFAGIGLVRMALEQAGFEVVFANDNNPIKQRLYAANFDASHFVLDDIRNIPGQHLPAIELATASFPCTDLSLAGGREGLGGKHSGLFWEFARILGEMGHGRPKAVLVENVPSFASSQGGRDLYEAIKTLNALGYWCDLLLVDARHFIPQSRPRLFIIGSQEPLSGIGSWEPSVLRPAWIQRFVKKYPELRLSPSPLTVPPQHDTALADVVERLPDDDLRWWDEGRLERFLNALSPRQQDRLNSMRWWPELTWATAYRRTRDGKPMWEIRADSISGCLRTARGGSSKQALVQAGRGDVRVRWMTATEYARLQGAPDFRHEVATSQNQAMFGFGDAVCVPVVKWIAEVCLKPILVDAARIPYSSSDDSQVSTKLSFSLKYSPS